MKTRILLVEDDPVLSELIAMIIEESETMEVTAHANSSNDALQLAEFNEFDVALLDVVLVGDDDGIILAGRLKKKKGIPCIIMTGFGGKETVERAMPVEPLGFLNKPFNFDTFVSHMEHYVSLKDRPMDRCPSDRQYGDIVCRDGQLWELTYSEMGPPDSRQHVGECPWPGHNRAAQNEAGDRETDGSATPLPA